MRVYLLVLALKSALLLHSLADLDLNCDSNALIPAASDPQSFSPNEPLSPTRPQ
jgi:hypothetical protein